MTFNILFLVFLVVFFCYQWLKSEREFRTECAFFDTDKVFSEWRLRNQGVYIGLSEEGRKLVTCCLEAYDQFLKTHSRIDGSKHRKWLVSQFYDFPPKHPDGMPAGKKKGALPDALFFTPH